jgi:hypothetical protein
VTTLVGGIGGLGNHRIAYSNLAAGIAPVVTSEASGYEAANALTWISSQKWKAANSATQYFQLDLGSAVGVDCFGLYKHNLGDVAGSLLVQYSTSSLGGTFTTLFSIVPGAANSGGNRTLFRVNSNQVTAQYWQFVFSGHNGPPAVGVALLGASTQLPAPDHPFMVPRLNRDTEILNNQSESGEFLGRSVLRHGMKSGFKLGKVQETWARQYWEPIANAMEINPFFWAWDANRYPDDAYFCFIDKRPKDTKSVKPVHVDIEATFFAK